MNIDWNSAREWVDVLLPALFGLLGTIVGGIITDRIQTEAQKRQFEESRKDHTRDKLVVLISEAMKWTDTVILLAPILPGLTDSESLKALSSGFGEDLKSSGSKVDQALQYLLFYIRDKKLRQKLVDFHALWEKRLEHTTGPLVEDKDPESARRTALRYVGEMRQSVSEMRELAEEVLSVTVSSESC
ncbi:hypothetical protein [uncultured Bifidobacterium sp.]|uniref:hypothetical protein n=1 Tax=uncultured Bifidobacterium sp. TaxID=165187 RepID=UPI0026254A7E|nr:hypothetical protein [uncultured Bifidobacterium sp.]